MGAKRLLPIRGMVLMLAVSALLSGCAWDGQLDFLGYTTRPMYDCSIRTVRVPIFGNKSYQRDIEFQLTQAVVREIQVKTPYRVVQDRQAADTELIGTIVSVAKNVVNINQLGETRQAEITIGVELVWRDLRTGRTNQLLSKDVRPGEAPVVSAPGAPSPPVLVQDKSNYIPEVGGTNAAALTDVCNRLAVQIVSMMEKPW
jgi:hypothetical protein